MMGGFFRKFADFLSYPSHGRTMGILAFLVIVLAIPLTVNIAQKQQELRQRAAETTECAQHGGTCDGSACGQFENKCLNDSYTDSVGTPPGCLPGRGTSCPPSGVNDPDNTAHNYKCYVSLPYSCDSPSSGGGLSQTECQIAGGDCINQACGGTPIGQCKDGRNCCPITTSTSTSGCPSGETCVTPATEDICTALGKSCKVESGKTCSGGVCYVISGGTSTPSTQTPAAPTGGTPTGGTSCGAPYIGPCKAGDPIQKPTCKTLSGLTGTSIQECIKIGSDFCWYDAIKDPGNVAAGKTSQFCYENKEAALSLTGPGQALPVNKLTCANPTCLRGTPTKRSDDSWYCFEGDRWTGNASCPSLVSTCIGRNLQCVLKGACQGSPFNGKITSDTTCSATQECCDTTQIAIPNCDDFITQPACQAVANSCNTTAGTRQGIKDKVRATGSTSCNHVTVPAPGESCTLPSAVTTCASPNTCNSSNQCVAQAQPPATPGVVAAGNIQLTFALKLDGLGGLGTRGTGSQFANPVRKSRNVTVDLVGSQGTTTKTGSLRIDNLQTTIDMGQLPSGAYTIKVKADGFVKRNEGSFSLTTGINNNLGTLPNALPNGNINRDNVVNASDFTAMLPCFLKPATGDCANADLDDSTEVNLFDFNLLLREFDQSDE